VERADGPLAFSVGSRGCALQISAASPLASFGVPSVSLRRISIGIVTKRSVLQSIAPLVMSEGYSSVAFL